MAKQFAALEPEHQKFIAAQHMFFCGTAADEGRVNVSPKDMESLHILGSNRLIWRNMTGSGNETAAHVAQTNRMTLMWCSFTKQPLILRVYGTVRTLHPRDADFGALEQHLPHSIANRQVFDVQIDMVQTSCGWKVPFFDHVGPRDVLDKWTAGKGEDGIKTAWEEHNQHSIDGLPTYILGDCDA